MLLELKLRGFILSTILGLKFNLGVLMIRKQGKLPGSTIKQKYDIEYGNAIMEIQSESIKNNENVLIADDLIATGGTCFSCCKTCRRTWRQCNWICNYGRTIFTWWQ